MRTYLKKMRRTLMEEGKLMKYISYAAGEIIIVVIGIILALYLNNLNHEKADHKLELLYYQTLKNQLNEDFRVIKDVMDYDQAHLNQFIYAKRSVLLNEKVEMDTLAKIALNMVRYADFRRKSNIYQTLVNSGEISIITNKRIREALESLEQQYLYINRLEANHETIVYSQVIPDLRQVMRFDPLKIEDPVTFFSFRFLNYFDVLIILMNEKKEAYRQAENELVSAIELIDRELQD